jgi:hypothetical protein
MGKFDFQFDEELTKQLERLEDFDNIAPKLLDGAVVILENRVRNEVAKHKQTGDLYNSIKASKATKNKYGWHVCVRPIGRDRKGTSNMEKLAHLEYGYKSKYGKQISPKPILTKAINDAKEEVEVKMQEIFNEEVG